MIKRSDDYQPKAETARSIKSRTRRLLADNRIAEVGEYFENEPRVRRAVMSLLFDRKPEMCLRAARAIGAISRIEAREDVAIPRETIRKIFWQMGEESGGLCWYGSEAVGEILVEVPELISDFWRILVVYTKEEPFERGSFRALYRLADKYGKLGEDHASTFLTGLDDNDPSIRAYSILGLAKTGENAVAHAKRLTADGEEALIFDNATGEFERRTVGEIASDVTESSSGNNR